MSDGNARIVVRLTERQHRVIGDMVGERERQRAKWGTQDHPDGTGYSGEYVAGQEADSLREIAQQSCEAAFRDGRGTWRHILAEEIAEAFAEDDETRLRNELIQVAAVAVQWCEAIDRRRENR